MTNESMMQAYGRWVDIREDARSTDFHAYACSIADSRYVTRRVLRIVSEQAKQEGLDPLQHQALLQVYGTQDTAGVAVSGLANRLDIAAAFASRLTSQLEAKGLVERRPSAQDRRVISVVATDLGVAMLRKIDAAVHQHVAYFQLQLEGEQRVSALAIYAFYVGLEPDSAIAREIRAAMRAIGNADQPSRPERS